MAGLDCADDLYSDHSKMNVPRAKHLRDPLIDHSSWASEDVYESAVSEDLLLRVGLNYQRLSLQAAIPILLRLLRAEIEEVSAVQQIDYEGCESG